MNKQKKKHLSNILNSQTKSWDERFHKARTQGSTKFKAQGESFVLVSEDTYSEMKKTMTALQNSVGALLNTVGNNANNLPSPKKSYSDQDEELVKKIAKK